MEMKLCEHCVTDSIQAGTLFEEENDVLVVVDKSDCEVCILNLAE